MFDDAREFLTRNAEWFDIFYRTGSSSRIAFKNNELYSLSESEYSGFGIRVKVNGRIGFSFANDPDAVMQTAQSACALAAHGECEEFLLPGKTDSCIEDNCFDRTNCFDTKEQIDTAAAHIDAVLNKLPAALCDLNISHGIHTTRLINSNGFDAAYTSPVFSASVSAEIINKSGARIDTYEHIASKTCTSYKTARETVIERCRMAEHTVPAPHGKIAVIFTPHAASQLLSIVTNGLHAAPIYKGRIVLYGQARQKAFQ